MDAAVAALSAPLYVRCYDRFSRMGAAIQVSEQEDREMLEELRDLPERLPLYQRQVQRFFDLVLDGGMAMPAQGPVSLSFYLLDRRVRN